MIRHFFLTVTRNLLRNKWVALINIGGLSLGLACSLLILLYLRSELSYDRFHRNRDRLYQLTCVRSEGDGTSERFAIAAQVQGPAFRQEVPEVKEYVRVMAGDVVIRQGGELFNQRVSWVDPGFFTVFSFPLRSGSAATVFSGLHNVVLTETAARKYFGAGEAVGHSLQLSINGRFEPFVVSGIAVDPPLNSSIRFDVLLPFPYYQKTHPDNGWMWVSFPTYFLLSPGADIMAVNKKMQQVYRERAKDEIDLNALAGYQNRFEWALLPMTSMHFRSEYKGTPDASDPVYAYILSGIALFVLLIAGINFVNLAIAQSLKRAREIGIRKVAGASRSQLLLQFLGESMVTSGLAFVVAAALAAGLLPAFGEMAGKPLRLGPLADWSLAGELLALVPATGLMAGLYPAVVLSRFRPVETLSGAGPRSGRNRLGQVLVIVQFLLATVLITGTLFIYSQFRLLTTTQTGIDGKNLLAFTVPRGVSQKPVMEYFRSELSKVPGVVSAGYQNIGKFGGKTIVNQKEFTAQYVRIDDHYPGTLGIPLIRGRTFSAAFPGDSAASVLVNETLVRRAGLSDGLGGTIDYLNLPGWGSRKLHIAGVLRDFHYKSLKEPIEPMVFLQDDALPLGQMYLRLRPADVPATLVRLEKRYHQLDPDRPFGYEFADEAMQRAYEPEARWGKIVAAGAGITVLVAISGLFALSLFIIQKRKKEISVRKVLGAGVWQLAGMIAFDFGRLVLIALLLAIPVGYRVISQWLQSYPYRIPLAWWRFGLAGLLILSIALLTVSYHAIRAAMANPVQSLKNE